MAHLIRCLALLALLGPGACVPVGPSPAPDEPSGATVRWTPAAIVTEGYESSPTFTPDGQEMYFVSADRRFRNYRILRSQCALDSNP